MKIDADEWLGPKPEDFLTKLRDQYHAQADLLEEAKTFAGSASLFRITRFGTSSLHLSQTQTIERDNDLCQRFVFFDAPGKGAARRIDPPPGVAHYAAAFCSYRTGYAGEIDGVPAFIAQNDMVNILIGDIVELSVSSWRDGKWLKEDCSVTISFSDTFEAIDQFCKGVDCDRMAKRAESLAKEFDEGLFEAPRTREELGIFVQNDLATQGEIDAQLPDFRRHLAVQGRPRTQLQTFVLTFGANSTSNVGFASDTIFLPMVVGREKYIARVGRAAFAQRVFADYLVAIYKEANGRLEPAAAFYVAKIRVKPTKAEVR